MPGGSRSDPSFQTQIPSLEQVAQLSGSELGCTPESPGELRATCEEPGSTPDQLTRSLWGLDPGITLFKKLQSDV